MKNLSYSHLDHSKWKAITMNTHMLPSMGRKGAVRLVITKEAQLLMLKEAIDAL